MVSGAEGEGVMPDILQTDKTARWSSPMFRVSSMMLSLGQRLIPSVGMNVLAAPFLYAMPTQVEAFACFSTFIEEQCPLYVQPTLVGVHRGLEVGQRPVPTISFRYVQTNAD
jgi:cell cycle arrest protein BUB2